MSLRRRNVLLLFVPYLYFWASGMTLCPPCTGSFPVFGLQTDSTKTKKDILLVWGTRIRYFWRHILVKVIKHQFQPTETKSFKNQIETQISTLTGEKYSLTLYLYIFSKRVITSKNHAVLKITDGTHFVSRIMNKYSPSKDSVIINSVE